MAMIRINDKYFTHSIDGKRIEQAIKKIAHKITEEYSDKNPLFLVVLNGAFIFAADLLREFNYPCQVSFIKLSSYNGTQSTENVQRIIGLNENIEGRHVVVLEDIIDTGITMENLLMELHSMQPASVKVATLLFKEEAFIKSFTIDFIGLTIPNLFIIGYGLDYNGYGRNYPDIYQIITE